MSIKDKHNINLKERKIAPPFIVEDTYFDALPHQIQQKVNTKKPLSWNINWKVGLGFATALTVTTIVWFSSNNVISTDAMIASISEEALIAYLEEEEISTLDPFDLTLEDAMDLALEEAVVLPELDFITQEQAENALDKEALLYSEEDLYLEEDLDMNEF